MKQIIITLILLVDCANFIAQAQNTSLLYEADKAYQSSDFTKAYTLFATLDSIESISYYFDLWMYYISAEKTKDSVKAETLLYRIVQSNGIKRDDFNQKFFEDIGLRERSYWPTLDSLIQLAENRRCKPFMDSLDIMVKTDQDIRQKLHEQGGSDDISKQMRIIDSTNTAKLQALVAQYGFPSWKLVGRLGTRYAWLIAQHSQEYLPEFLRMYRQAVIENDAEKRYLAYLEDRYLMSQGRPQIYGTQMNQKDTVLGYYPIMDMKNLDHRRYVMELGPIADYTKRWGVDTLQIYPDYVDYMNSYYPNYTKMYISIDARWHNNDDTGEWYYNQLIYYFPKDLEALALFLWELDTNLAVQQAKKMVLFGKCLDEKWVLPPLLMDSVKADYDELRADYERLITKDEDAMLKSITSFDTLVKVLDNGFYPRYTFDAWNRHIPKLISDKARTLSRKNYQPFFEWLFEQVKLGNYHLFDYAELYDDVYFRLFGKSYYGQKSFKSDVPLYKPREVNQRRSAIQLLPLEVWQRIRERLE